MSQTDKIIPIATSRARTAPGMDDGRPFDRPANDALFAGAGIIICDAGNRPCASDDLMVSTAYAKELSAMVFKLKETFASQLDFDSKNEFYPRLARAAISHLDANGDNGGIVDAVASEAKDIAADWGKPVYFAYGSNMDPEQMRRRCPDAVLVGTAVLHGYEIALDFKGKMTITRNVGEDVYGTLWLLKDEDESSLCRFRLNSTPIPLHTE